MYFKLLKMFSKLRRYFNKNIINYREKKSMNANMYLYYELINFFVFSLSKTLLRIRKNIFKIF